MTPASDDTSDEKNKKRSGKDDIEVNSKRLDTVPQQSRQPTMAQSQMPQHDHLTHWLSNGPGQGETSQSSTEAFNQRYRAILGNEDGYFVTGKQEK